MILVTGHRGFIGSLLINRIGIGVGIDVREGENLLTCKLPKDIDTIFHLAAQTSVEASWSDPMHDADNLKMTVRLAHHYQRAKIVYTNSAASLDESSPYGFSKKACARYLHKFHKDTVSCILPNVYGPGSRSVVDIFKERTDVTIYGDGKAVRDYVHVDDIVDGLLLAAGWAPGEYMLGSGIGTTVMELAEGKNIRYEPARKEARISVLSNTTPNWAPKIKVYDYLK